MLVINLLVKYVVWQCTDFFKYTNKYFFIKKMMKICRTKSEYI